MKIAYLSDTHGNLAALKAVLADAAGQGAGRLFHLGDAVGYGPCPEECIGLLLASGADCLLGNHEQALLNPDLGARFNPHVTASLELTRKLVPPDMDAILARWPLYLEEAGVWMVHGFPPDSATRYLFDVSDAQLARVARALPVEFCLVGHTHELQLVTIDGERVERDDLETGPFRPRPGRRALLNIGSVGQPRDGDPRAKYLLWDPDELAGEIRAVAYDVAATQSLLAERGFPETYARRLG